MKKILKFFAGFVFLFVISVLAFFPSNVFADYWTQQSNTGTMLTSVSSSADGTYLATVAPYSGSDLFGDYIYTSNDSGATWVKRTGAGKKNWSSVTSSANGQKLAAVIGLEFNDNCQAYCLKGGIFTSNNYGVTWVDQSATSGVRLWSSVASNSDGTKLIASEKILNASQTFGNVYLSTDSGVTWTPTNISGTEKFLQVVSTRDPLSADGTKLAVLSNLYVWTSIDSGATWTQQPNSNHSFNSIAVSADGTKLVGVSAGGAVWISSNFGVTWTQQNISGGYNLYSITISNDGGTFIAGDGSGNVFLSYDSGATWTQQLLSGNSGYQNIAASFDGTKLVVANNSGLIFTASLIPTVTTDNASGITATGATLNGNIVDISRSNPTIRGFEYGLTTSYGTVSSTTGSYGTGAYTANISGLTCNTTYHFRSYTTNSAGTSYGSDKSFLTSACVPVVGTQSATLITTTSAKLNGTLTSDGGVEMAIPTGFEYGLTVSYGSTVSTGNRTSGVTFSSDLSGLTLNTTYHFRSYATNSVGTSYGDDLSFTTSQQIAASLTTEAATSVAGMTAVLNANVTSYGSSYITERGFNYGTTHSYGSNVHDGPGLYNNVPYTKSASSLVCGTTYYFESYAINPAGTSYGGEQSFTTGQCLPTVTTEAPTLVTTTSARLNGNLTYVGGSNVSAAGFDYGIVSLTYGYNLSQSMSANLPVLFDSGSAPNSLSPNTTYYYRSYATNSFGTVYGSEQSFTTASNLGAPAVTTNAPTNISINSFTGNGTIVNDGGSSITGTAFTFETLDGMTSYSVTSANTTNFSNPLAPLVCNTQYHYKALATNTTPVNMGNLIDGIDPNGGDGGWVNFTSGPCAPIAGITAPVAGATPTATLSDTTQYSATISWNGSPSTFASGTVYTATITLTPKSGYTLTGTPANYFTVAGATATNSVDSGVITAVFPATLPIITTDAATSITSNSAIGNGTVVGNGSGITRRGFFIRKTVGGSGATLTMSASSANPSSSSIAAAECNTEYEYQFITTNTANYSALNILSHSDPLAVYGSFVTFTTGLCPISAPIAGITVPVTGATPTATLTDTTQYSATISWNGSPSTFASGTVYTATIILTPKSGYTLTGTTANYFTVAGATATNSINSGVIVAVFPATAAIVSAPTVMTDAPTNISANSTFQFQGNGTIVNDGGESTTTTYYEIYSNTGTLLSSGFGAGAYNTSDQFNFSGISISTCNTSYQYRMGAENSAGITSWGSLVAFTSGPCASIAGITVPVTGSTPTATIADTTQYSATISWNGSPSTFASGTVYTATIILTPKSGYTLTGTPANYFTVAGATATNSADSGVIAAVFPATTQQTFAIGTAYQGGYIFYVLQSGDFGYTPGAIKGLVVPQSDLGGSKWSDSNILIGGTQTAIGYGQANTTIIVNGSSDVNMAAKVANNAVINGYSDWYLPSLEEAKKIIERRSLLPNIPIIDQNYWTSSEVVLNSASIVNFFVGTPANTSQNGYAQKVSNNFVLPIRSFDSASIFAPTVITATSATNTTANTITLGGNITATGGANATERGIHYGLTTGYGTDAKETSGSFGTGVYTENITGLTCSTTYHYQAYAINSGGTGTGSDQMFTTSACLSIPSVTTITALPISTTTATLNASITAIGGAGVTERGFYYGLTAGYGTIVNDTGGSYNAGVYTKAITGLTCNTAYHYKAYAINSGGTGTGSDGTFTTSACPLPQIGGIASITGTARFGQMLTANISGITYSPSISNDVPTYQWNRNSSPIGNATLSTYTLVQADIGYAISVTVIADGTHAIGSVTSSTTSVILKADAPSAPSAPTLSSKTSTSVTLNTVSGNEFSNDAGSNWQDSNIFSGLAGGTQYTFIARVKTTATTNASVSSLGLSVTTNAAVSPDQVIGLSAVAASSSQINLSWTAPANGGSTITGYKIERATPIGGTMTILVASNTSTTYNDTGLTASTGYSYQVSAINAVGTGTVSAISNATTNAVVTGGGGGGGGSSVPAISKPTLFPLNASMITGTTTITLNANIYATGGVSISTRGFNFGKTTTYGTNTTENGTFGIGTFSANISSLTCGTTYHFRSYATNSVGITYGSDQTFTTTLCGVTPNPIPVVIPTVPDDGTSDLPPTFSLSSVTRSLKLGMTGDDILALQQFLNTHGYIIATFGNGSPGNESTYMGAKTIVAVKKFQKDHGLTADGAVGKKTRELMIKLEGNITTPVVVAPIVPVVTVPKVPVVNTPVISSPVVAPKSLKLGMTGEDVKALQVYLNTHGYIISPAGDRSPGHETNYFGTDTLNAVKKFQKANGLFVDGAVGKTTKALMDKLAGVVKKETKPETKITPKATEVVQPKEVVKKEVIPKVDNTKKALTRTLKLGMTGEDVKALQVYLNTHGYAISASGSGSLGNENTYFSVNTMLSVILFQKDKGLSPSGMIDPNTWETMN